MASRLSDEDIALWMEALNKAEPYAYDAPEMNTLDGDNVDHDRVMATFAKRTLEEAGILEP